ncbi:MAG: class I SAM-dependent methyltransferase [Alphaproteobacteria bacterium]
MNIEDYSQITAFWNEVLRAFDNDCRLLDLACGAGSIIRSAHAAGFTNLVGVDISKDAIALLKNEFPSAEGYVISANNTQLAEASFDVIVSQFGFEYAGAAQTTPEIARLLKPGGQFIALAHKAGSVIETEVKEKRDEAKDIIETQFIDAARYLFSADNAPGDETAFQNAFENFRPAQDKLLALARAHEGFAAHLYTGTQTLVQNRQNYSLEGIMDWLDGMEVEIFAFHGRMDSMVAASLSEEDVAALFAATAEAGLTGEKPDVFCTGFEGTELAWVIKASKSI